MSDKIKVPEPDVLETEKGWNDTYNKKWILNLVEDSVRQERIKICEICEKFNGYFCSDCGCYLPFKTRIAQWTCPQKKW